MRIVKVSDYNEFRDCRKEWDDILSRSMSDNVFLTYEWVDAYIRHFLKKRSLFILKILEGERLIGIAPLMIKRCRYFGLPVRVVSFIGTVVSDRMDFIMDGDRKKAMALVLDYLMRIQKEWDLIDLHEIPEETRSREAIEAWLKKRKYINILGPSSRHFFIDFNGKDCQSLCQRFSRGFRDKYRRVNNKMPSIDLEFRDYRDNGIETERLFSEVCMIEGHSWKAMRRKGIFLKEDVRNFHREIFDRFSRNKWLYLLMLTSGGRPIAYRYGYLYNQRLYSYNHSFDERYSSASPGRMLILWALKGCDKQGISEFDFLRGEEKWKRMLTKDFKMHGRVRIFRDTLYSRYLYYLQSRVMPFLKKSRFLYRAWMRIREILGWK